MSSLTTVFVSGATGFIAQHIVIDLLKNGYKVIGTVRSKSKGDNFISNLKLYKIPNFELFNYEIVSDISKPGAFDNALKSNQNISVFIHTASPFKLNVQDVKLELLEPAIEGTNNALNAIIKYAPEVKRVVLTSSIAAIQTFGKLANPKEIYNEQSWNKILFDEATESPLLAYVGSKTFAEKAAWKFINDNNPNFTLSIINPAMVFGPQAFPIVNPSELNTSSEVIYKLLQLKPEDKVPDDGGSFIDVRDVAHAHIVAFEKDDAQNKRLMLLSGPYNAQAIINIIRKDFKTLDLILPQGDPSKGKLPKTSERFQNEKTKKILGFEFIDLDKTIHDSVQQILGDSLPLN